MKALEILKSTYESINYLGLGSISKEWDEQEFIELEKAIKELEELNNRSCKDCKKQDTFMCPITSFDRNMEDFNCNRYEKKENK